MRRAFLACAWLLAAACDPPFPPFDAGADGAVDAAPPPAADAETMVPAGDASAEADASDSPADGGGSFDGGPLPCLCEERPPECHVSACDGEVCVIAPAPDGTPCGPEGAGACVRGACPAGLCGDGHRDRGPSPPREGCDDGNGEIGDACSPSCTPTVLVVSSRPLGEDAPSGTAVAEDGRGELLFVWSATDGKSMAVHGRRFTAAGEEIDPHDAPITIAVGMLAGWPARPVVAGLAGGGWAVAWTGADGDGDQAGVLVRRVRPSGLLGPVRVANAEVRGNQHEPAIARWGSGFALVWTDDGGASTELGRSRVVFRTFDEAALPTSAESSMTAASASAREPALASTASRLLVAWTEEPDDSFAVPRVMARRLGGAGADREPFGMSSADGSSAALAALPSGDFVAAWVQRDADYRGDVLAREVRAAGDPLAASSVTAIADAPAHAELAPRAASLDGAAYAVTYEDGGRRRGLVLAASPGASLAPEAAELAGHLRDGFQGDVTMLRTSRGLWLAWSDDGSLGDPLAYRSFLAFLLPHD